MHVSRALWCVCVYMFTCLTLLGFVEYVFVVIDVFVNCFVFSVSGCYCFLSVFKYLFLKGTAFKLRMYAEKVTDDSS